MVSRTGMKFWLNINISPYIYRTVQYCTVYNSTIRYSAFQYIMVQYSTVHKQYNTVQCSSIHYGDVPYCTELYSTVQLLTFVQYTCAFYRYPLEYARIIKL